ncbi:hypothetical protein FACS1894219_11660 [Clostridia bacterium]|nr:hypothetical protein FACS1894219_11660 [Clostridia bacterium]
MFIMFKSKLTRCLLLMIVSSVIHSVFTGCAEQNIPTATTAAEIISTQPSTEVNPRDTVNPNLAAVNMNGYVFTIAQRTEGALGSLSLRDTIAEAESSDVLSVEVYKRNLAIMEKYNCVIRNAEFASGSGPLDSAKKSALAGEYSFDLVIEHMLSMAGQAAAGTFTDIRKIDNIDTTAPYWDQNANYGMSIGGRLFLALSDLSFSTAESAYNIYFNKTLAQNYGLEDIYQIVLNNEWTFDKMDTLIRQGYSDLNGNGVSDEEDAFGYASGSAMNFLWSGGSHIMTKDENDIPVVDFLTERTIAIYAKAFAITNNPFTYSKDAEWHVGESTNIFKSGRALFYSNQVIRLEEFRDVNFDFGIIPYPKWDSKQENWYSYIDGGASMMAVPLNLPHPDWTGMIIEDMSFMAYRDILPTYYEVVLGVKLIRDDESVKMLDIIYNSKTFDPGYVWGGYDFWFPFVTNIRDKKEDFVSTFERRLKGATKNLQNTVDKLLAIE